MKPLLSAAILVALAAGSAHAATISVSDFSKSAYDALVTPGATVENFEGFSERNIDDNWSESSVGAFYSLGGTGSGGTVNDGPDKGNFAGNDGTKLALRDGSVYGRTSTTATLSGNAGDDMFLDSNDTWGIGWVASLGGTLFDRIVLTLTDATDVGATMHIVTGDHSVSFSGLGNGAKRIVEIAFGGGVPTATILFENRNADGSFRRNDGFSVDDIALSAVPLPAGAWLMLGGFGALAALRRRKRTA